MFNWINFLTYASITAITPGPNNIMSMSNASRYGLKKSLPFNLGVWCGFSIVMIIGTALSSALHSLLPVIKMPMLIAGAAYMLYLAWKTYKSRPEFEGDQAKQKFASGLFLQFINPKIYIYCLVSMEAYILPVYQGDSLKLFGFAILLATIGSTGNICWAAFGSVFKVLFSKYARVTNTIMAVLLVYCAISLFL